MGCPLAARPQPCPSVPAAHAGAHVSLLLRSTRPPASRANSGQTTLLLPWGGQSSYPLRSLPRAANPRSSRLRGCKITPSPQSHAPFCSMWGPCTHSALVGLRGRSPRLSIQQACRGEPLCQNTSLVVTSTSLGDRGPLISPPHLCAASFLGSLCVHSHAIHPTGQGCRPQWGLHSCQDPQS